MKKQKRKTKREIAKLDAQMRRHRRHPESQPLPYYFICDDCVRELGLEPAFPGQCVTSTIKECERCGLHGTTTPVRDFVEKGGRTLEGKEPEWD